MSPVFVSYLDSMASLFNPYLAAKEKHDIKPPLSFIYWHELAGYAT